jgi:hypothetical protein
MPPAVIFLEEDFQVQAFSRRDDEWLGATGGENWEEELLIPGRMVYVGQGQMQFVRIDEPDPGLMFPKRRWKKKKRTSPQPPPPAPAPVTPAPSTGRIGRSCARQLLQFYHLHHYLQ